jgi:hypothetical protein
MMVAVHSVHENITVPASSARARRWWRPTSTCARRGWRMIVHHASPAPSAIRQREAARRAAGPKILH